MATKAQLEVPAGMQRICRRFERWRRSHRGRLPIPEGLWASAAAGSGPPTRRFPNGQGFAPGIRQAQADGGSRQSRPTADRADSILRSDAPGDRPAGLPDRAGRASRQDAHSVERGHSIRLGRTHPDMGVGVIQITPQMRILVAIEAVDGRKGIDSLARLCQEKLQSDPFSGCLFVFRSRRGTSIRILVYDGQGFWLAQKRLSQGRFVWWPSGKEPARRLEAHQAQLLLAAGNPETAAAPVWRKVS